MTRKDTILIAVLVNAGLLAILFATAVIYDDADNAWEQPAVAVSTPAKAATVAVKETPQPRQETPTWIALPVANDEVDRALSEAVAPSIEAVPIVAVKELPQEKTAAASQERVVEVVVKKGDALDKIARANGTTVSAIKKANQLQNEKLKVGQVLKIPVSASTASSAPVAKEETATIGEGELYTIKNGDSPWKIAKQFNVNYEDIVRLNGLDEEKARNLKPGDKIRVK